MTNCTTPMKTCTKCGVEKPATTEFWQRRKAGRGGLSAHCKVCDQNAEQVYRESQVPPSLRRRREEIADRKRRGVWVCSVCHEEKPLAEFNRCNGQVKWCKDCNRAKARRYYEEHREHCCATVRDYAKRNPEKVRGHHRRGYERNREAFRDRACRWFAEHPEQRRAYTRNRRARIKGLEGSHTGADVLAQYERQHGRCFWCGVKVGDEYHADHVVPVSLGGSNGPENIVVSCPHCNVSKHNKHPMEWAGCLL